jgi:hypothetical protein
METKANADNNAQFVEMTIFEINYSTGLSHNKNNNKNKNNNEQQSTKITTAQ